MLGYNIEQYNGWMPKLNMLNEFKVYPLFFY